MSDFDFDEIDKAVTGALGSDSESGAKQQDASRQTTPEVESRENPVPARTNQPDRPVSQMPAARRGTSGRFMDMVHPSSDMRRPGESATSAASTPPVTPVAPSRIPEPPTFYKDTSAPADESTESTEEDTTKAADWSAPLDSPFLPDAKVEKRPLGGVGGEAVTPAPQLFPEPEEELLEAPEEELKLEAPEEPLLEATTEPEVEPPEPNPALESQIATPSSITQQYKEQPSAAGEPGAIFDTESYHKPLAAPAKKRSGAWVFLWILLLVLAGAGIGAAVYLYVLPLI